MASLFATSLLAGLVALWGLLEVREREGPTARAIHAARAVVTILRSPAGER